LYFFEFVDLCAKRQILLNPKISGLNNRKNLATNAGTIETIEAKENTYRKQHGGVNIHKRMKNKES